MRITERTGGRRYLSPPLHPLEVRVAPRRSYQCALVLQLLSTCGVLAVGTGVLLPASSLALPAVGLRLAVVGGTAAWICRRRAWAGLPPPGRRAVMPVTDDRRYTAAAALLLTAWAAAVSPTSPTGGLLAALIGMDAAFCAIRSVVWLRAAHASHPTRRLPALLTAAVLSWTAAATAGGLGVHGVLALAVDVAPLVAAGYAVLVLLRRTIRP